MITLFLKLDLYKKPIAQMSFTFIRYGVNESCLGKINGDGKMLN